MISTIIKSKVIEKQLEGLDEFEKNILLATLAKSFVISSEVKGKEYRIISFKWPNVKQGINLLNEALNETLKNVKRKLLENNSKTD